MLDPEIDEYDDETSSTVSSSDSYVIDDDIILDEPIESLVQAKLSQPVRAFREFMAKGNFRTEKGDPRANIIDNTDKKTYIVPPTRLTEFFQRLEACRMDG